MSWRGVFSGVLALVALEAVLRSEQSAARFGGIFKDIGALAEHIISPAVPAIPDIAGVGTTT